MGSLTVGSPVVVLYSLTDLEIPVTVELDSSDIAGLDVQSNFGVRLETGGQEGGGHSLFSVQGQHSCRVSVH